MNHTDLVVAAAGILITVGVFVLGAVLDRRPDRRSDKRQSKERDDSRSGSP